MSDLAIKVEDLGKLYHIGGPQARYKTIRETITDGFKSPFRRVGRLVRGQGSAADLDRTIWALKDVSFGVQQGEVLGIIGRNGAGKSTLLKIMSRITEPTEGQVMLRGRVGSLLEVGTGFHPELTGRENIYLNGAILGMKRREIDRKFDEIVNFAEIEQFIDTPVKHYSSGMYVRLAFAVAAHLEPEILLVDEVLAVGDMAFQKKCMGKMGEVARGGRTVLFVSHNMAAIQNLCPRSLVIESGDVLYDGLTSESIRNYEGVLNTTDSSSDLTNSSVLYQNLNNNNVDDFCVTRVEVLDEDDSPKGFVHTWDHIKIRISFFSKREVRNGSVALTFNNSTGSQILLLSTQPDSNITFDFRTGLNQVVCEILELPLAADNYYLGIGLAIPRIKWLYKLNENVPFSVHPVDVYGSGLAPEYPRTVVATKHNWIVLTDSAKESKSIKAFEKNA